MYQFSIVETVPVGTVIGRVKAEDSDVGENTDMTYQVQDEEGLGAFRVTTDSSTQEALISVHKVSRWAGLRTRVLVEDRGTLWGSLGPSSPPPDRERLWVL